MKRQELATDVLRGVSRSFYLSLRMLPGRMREVVSLAYLLARTSDTLADTHEVAVDVRSDLLVRFAGLVTGGAADAAFGADVAERFLPRQGHQAERVLLENAGACIVWLERLKEEEAVCVRRVVETITGGQLLDLERFGGAEAGKPVCLADDAELEDYAWRVAGCVGKFWTELGFLTFGTGFAGRSRGEMEQAGIAYGKGLQLVNILRDTAADMRQGRCYLPVNHPGDGEELAARWRQWLGRTRPWLEEGLAYARAVRPWRVRVATALPARLGVKTLEMLEKHSAPPAEKVKVSRSTVWRELAAAVVKG